jgi:hypothetical protein
VSLPRIAVLSLGAVLGLSVAETFAQIGNSRPVIGSGARPAPTPVNQYFRFGPGPQIRAYPGLQTQFTPESVAAAQFASNAALIGAGLSAIPPYALGYNPYPSPILTGGPVVAASPYGISAVGGYNPYAGGGSAAALSISPYGGYSLSTVPSGSSGAPYSNSGGYGGYGNQDPFGSYLKGIASVTAATGQYDNQIQTARITREQSRQMALETQRKQIKFEMWYETVRSTAPKLIARENETTLDEARNYASPAKIWSGDSLNQLLRAAIKSGKLNSVPNIPLKEDTLKQINLTDRSSRGNVGLLKDGGGLNWPLVLQEPPFNDQRTRLTLKIKDAVAHLKAKQPIPTATLRDAGALFKALTDKLNDSADDLSPTQYIAARRYLKQVGQAIRVLKGPRAANYFDNTWNARGKNVAELVDYMRKEGLVFAAAVPGDEAAYNALYHALRAFEAGTQRRGDK